MSPALTSPHIGPILAKVSTAEQDNKTKSAKPFTSSTFGLTGANIVNTSNTIQQGQTVMTDAKSGKTSKMPFTTGKKILPLANLADVKGKEKSVASEMMIP